MSYYIHVTDAAERDIQEAYDYIDLTLKNPTAADFLTESVGTSLQKLDRFPNQNPVVHDPFLYGLGIHFRSVYKELHADHETGAADNK